MSDIKNLLDQIRNKDEAAPITLNSILTSKISERIDQFKQDFVNRTFNGVRENIEDYSLEEINEWMLSEEYEQLDELSKTTLGNYIKKASSNADTNRSLQVMNAGNLGNTTAKDKRRFGEYSPELNIRTAQKAQKRIRGIRVAVDKLVKEEQELDQLVIEDFTIEELEEYMMSEEFKQLDEISGKLLGSYIQKARADKDKKFAHGRELDQDEKVKELRDKRRELGNSREYNSRGESKHRKTIDKLSNDIEKRKKKIDPNYPKSTSGAKRYIGIERAVKKLTTGKLTGE